MKLIGREFKYGNGESELICERLLCKADEFWTHTTLNLNSMRDYVEKGNVVLLVPDNYIVQSSAMLSATRERNEASLIIRKKSKE